MSAIAGTIVVGTCLMILIIVCGADWIKDAMRK